jgi:hypothetical protein
LHPPPGGRGTQSTATNAGSELRVLGVEGALDLIEHALFMIGEWHSSLLADGRSHHCPRLDTDCAGNYY